MSLILLCGFCDQVKTSNGDCVCFKCSGGDYYSRTVRPHACCDDCNQRVDWADLRCRACRDRTHAFIVRSLLGR